MTLREAPMCIVCKHRIKVDGAGSICTVYPKGVPEAIHSGHEDHRYPYVGDGGRRFDPDGSDAVKYVVSLYGPKRDYPKYVLHYGGAGRKLYDNFIVFEREWGTPEEKIPAIADDMFPIIVLGTFTPRLIPLADGEDDPSIALLWGTGPDTPYHPNKGEQPR